MNVDQILDEIRYVKNIEDVLEKYNWKDFESFVEFVFQQHDFETKRNFRFKLEKRYEIDVVAEKEIIICVDCKKWGKGRYKEYSLKKSGEKQIERANAYKIFTKTKKTILPLIITLTDEIIEQEFIAIPIWKLNEFLLNYR
ncbi:MAG: restriction endonuclease [Candidatus Aenigmarchaeota archaeon]|nr:restriction endonuclease [Candidatus Aenigmarchaeota archaeon]MBU5689027.1 restriction endonuclease [Candidatus Aenigmarchaeota archaeon]